MRKSTLAIFAASATSYLIGIAVGVKAESLVEKSRRRKRHDAYIDRQIDVAVDVEDDRREQGLD